MVSARDTKRMSICALVVTVALVLAGASVASASATPVSVTLTSANLYRALSSMRALKFGPLKREPTIWVSDGVHYQRVTGFGAAMTDSSAWLLYDQLPAMERAWVMEALFGAGGIDLNYIMVPIGASDFTATGEPYSYDDMPAGETDPSLANFSVAHDQGYILPALQDAMRLNPSTEILAEAWSAPGWMKANDALDNEGDDGVLLAADYQTFANYLVRFIEAYAQAGVPISAITPGNELGWTTEYPGMDLDSIMFITQNLAPTLRAAGLSAVKIYGLDGSGFDDAESMLENPALQDDMAGIAWHCYAGLEQMSMLQALDPAAHMIMDECSPGIVSYPTAETVIASLRNYAQAVDLWNLALNPLGGPKQEVPGCWLCSGLVTVDGDSAELNLNYYQLGQVSRFVRRGAVRVASTRFVSDFADAAADYEGGTYGVTPGLDNVAFLNPDGSRVLVVYNNGTQPARFQVGWHWRAFSYRLDPGSTVTFTWR